MNTPQENPGAPSHGKRCILFEDAVLPESALSIDHLGMYGNLPELPEETSLWLWHFTICGGLPRTCDSATVLRHAGETLRLATCFRERLLRSVPANFRDFKPEILEEWRRALETIITTAGTRAACSWVSPLLPEDGNFGRDPEEAAAEAAAGLDAAVKRAQEARR